MDVNQAIKRLAGEMGAECEESRGGFVISKIIAERRTFRSRKKLVYTARLAIDEQKRNIVFSESLKETGFGLATGGDEISPGWGFKKEAYKTELGPREGTIEEQSLLFGKDYKYSFDFSQIRKRFEDLARQYGLAFTYRIF